MMTANSAADHAPRALPAALAGERNDVAMARAEERPLLGKQIAVTRAEAQAGGFLTALKRLGAEPIACPAIAIAPAQDPRPLADAVERTAAYQWIILTSVNGVEALAAALKASGATPAMSLPRLAAIGPATAAALARHGLRAAFMPSSFVAEAMVEEIGDVAGSRVLLPRADRARPALARGLRARGAVVDDVVAYRTVPGPGAALLLPYLDADRLDAITFTSSSTVTFLLDGLGALGLARAEARAALSRAAVLCIGPITAQTARAEGLRVAGAAARFTTDGLLDLLLQHFAMQHGG